MVRGDRREMQTQHHEIVRVQLGIYENCTARITCRLLQVKTVWSNSEGRAATARRQSAKDGKA